MLSVLAKRPGLPLQPVTVPVVAAVPLVSTIPVGIPIVLLTTVNSPYAFGGQLSTAFQVVTPEPVSLAASAEAVAPPVMVIWALEENVEINKTRQAFNSDRNNRILSF